MNVQNKEKLESKLQEILDLIEDFEAEALEKHLNAKNQTQECLAQDTLDLLGDVEGYLLQARDVLEGHS